MSTSQPNDPRKPRPSTDGQGRSVPPNDATIVTDLSGKPQKPASSPSHADVTRATMPAADPNATQATMPNGDAMMTRPATGITNLQVDAASGVPKSMDPGTHHGQIWGDFQIGDLLGKGGMGAVYRGRQISLDRAVAIKVLPPHLSGNEDFRQRFQIEAKAVAKIQSANVIQVYGAGQHQGNHYFAMEYVEGDDLAERLKSGWRPSYIETIKLVAQATRGLVAAGEHGIIHRDIKPANMMLTKKGELKLMDFGLAKLATRETGLTMAGTIMGTVNYFSPEQGRGEVCDCRTDLYALGVVLYEMLTGRLPFTGQDPTSIIYQHIHQEPKAPREIDPQIPEHYQAVVLKCLQKKQEMRYQTASEMLRDLECLIEGRMPASAFVDPAALRSGGAVVRSAPFAKERRGRGLGMVVAAVLIAGAAGAWWWFDGRTRFAPPTSSVAVTPSQPSQPVVPVQPAQPATVVVVPDLAPARAHVTAGEWAQARALSQAALAEFPTNAEWSSMLAEVDAGEGNAALASVEHALAAGDLATASNKLDRARTLLGEQPSVTAASGKLSAAQAQAGTRDETLNQARRAMSDGDPEKALELLAALTTRYPEDAEIIREQKTATAKLQELTQRRAAAQEQILNGDRAMERKDYDSALLAYTAALQHDNGSKAAGDGLKKVTAVKERMAAERQRFEAALAASDLAAAKASLAKLKDLAPGSATVVMAESELNASKLEQEAADLKRREQEAALQKRVDGLLSSLADGMAEDPRLSDDVAKLSGELPQGDARIAQLTNALTLRNDRRTITATLKNFDAAVASADHTELGKLLADAELAERFGRLATYDGLVFASTLSGLEATPTGARASIDIRHALTVFPERLLHYQADLVRTDSGWRITSAALQAP